MGGLSFMFIYYAWSFLSWVGCNDFFLNLTRWWSTPSTLETTPEGEGSTSSSSMPRWYEMISVPMVLWSWYCTKRWKSWRWLASHRTRARVSIFKLLPSFTLLRSFKFWSFWCSSLVYYHPRQRLMFPIEHPLVQANIRGRLQKSRLQEDDLIDMTQRILNACLVWRFSSCCLVVLIFDVCRICQTVCDENKKWGPGSNVHDGLWNIGTWWNNWRCGLGWNKNFMFSNNTIHTLDKVDPSVVARNCDEELLKLVSNQRQRHVPWFVWWVFFLTLLV